MGNLVVTYLYPTVKKYLGEFLENIQSQTTNNFEVIFFNDGIIELENYLEKLSLDFKYTIHNISGSINEIRFKSISILASLKFENIIFQDADDLMTNNRVEENIKYLKDYDIVVNDLDLVDTKGKCIAKNFWSKRLPNEKIFSSDFISQKNIAGLGNTSIKKNLLSSPIKFSNKVIAIDWYLFYQLLTLSKRKGVFINTSRTLYRQHQENIAGLASVSEERVWLSKKIKLVHYKELVKAGYNFEDELLELEKIDSIEIKRLKNNTKHHFWWEETEYLR